MLTNTQVQATLTAALAKLDKQLEAEKDEIVQQKIISLKSSLFLLKAYSSSSNEHPGLRGLGLEEGMDWAAHILRDGFNATHLRFSFKGMLPPL